MKNRDKIIFITFYVIFLTIIVLMFTACSQESFRSSYEGCTVVSSTDGATIKCADGTSKFISNGQDGAQGPQGIAGHNGINGVDGQDGTNGVNGRNGIDGVNGQDGLDGAQGPQGIPGVNAPGTIGIVEVINPCGPEFNYEEVFLRLTNGMIIALYDGGNNLSRLSVLVPGNYMTTDTKGDLRCYFSVDANGNLYNQHH